MKFTPLYAILLTFILSCSNNSNTIKKTDIKLKDVSFNAVEKEITFNNIPNNIELLFNDWFNNNVKLSGYEGIVIVEITNYLEKIKDIKNGKLVELSLDFEVQIKKNKNKDNYFSGSVESFGSIQGKFSLSDLDIIIFNSQLELMKRFSDNF